MRIRRPWISHERKTRLYERKTDQTRVRSFSGKGRCKHHNASGRLASVFAAAEVVDEHLLDWLVVRHEHMADGFSADEVADFFGEIFGVVASAFERLGHEDD